MRILGLDPGEKRIGVALSDPLGITAQGIGVIEYTGQEEALQKVRQLCLAYAVEKIVVGLPLNMNGQRGPAAQDAAIFGDRLHDLLQVPVVLVDERLTSASAEKMLISGGVSRRKRKAVRDKLAAVLILEIYLNTTNNNDQRGVNIGI
ncbi:MAG TPA: Holliday junction resolvase RuvX [Candidatus Limnocylindrales bacterium]|nr:Holliday junction resolvase RuvX [Candidatus Limnocylindrales bacterium]